MRLPVSSGFAVRPDGVNGAVVNSSRAFIDYLKDRAAVLEWLAYVKLAGAATRRGAADRRRSARTIHEAHAGCNE